MGGSRQVPFSYCAGSYPHSLLLNHGDCGVMDFIHLTSFFLIFYFPMSLLPLKQNKIKPPKQKANKIRLVLKIRKAKKPQTMKSKSESAYRSFL